MTTTIKPEICIYGKRKKPQDKDQGITNSLTFIWCCSEACATKTLRKIR